MRRGKKGGKKGTATEPRAAPVLETKGFHERPRVRVADPSLAAGALKGSLANETKDLSLRKR